MEELHGTLQFFPRSIKIRPFAAEYLGASLNPLEKLFKRSISPLKPLFLPEFSEDAFLVMSARSKRKRKLNSRKKKHVSFSVVRKVMRSLGRFVVYG